MSYVLHRMYCIVCFCVLALYCMTLYVLFCIVVVACYCMYCFVLLVLIVKKKIVKTASWLFFAICTTCVMIQYGLDEFQSCRDTSLR